MWCGGCGGHFPAIRLMADANSAYTLADAEHLRKLDEFYLMMIEQPLATTTSSTTRSCRRKLEHAHLPG